MTTLSILIILIIVFLLLFLAEDGRPIILYENHNPVTIRYALSSIQFCFEIRDLWVGIFWKKHNHDPLLGYSEFTIYLTIVPAFPLIFDFIRSDI